MQMWLKVKGLVHFCLASSLGEHAVEMGRDVQTSESICHLLNAASVAGAAGIDSDAA